MANISKAEKQFKNFVHIINIIRKCEGNLVIHWINLRAIRVYITYLKTIFRFMSFDRETIGVDTNLKIIKDIYMILSQQHFPHNSLVLIYD